jgi:2-oxoisovalerate dehydrogenase E1 component
MLMGPDDYVCPYYRDRALVMGRGVTVKQLALDYMAKAESSSRGRQMPAHFSYREHNIWSVPTPTASQILPACGMAWGMQLDKKPAVAIATVGDAATRQGDFYEAVAFAKERQLPFLLIVEDNGYGISSPTRKINPFALNVITKEDWYFVDGWDVEAVYRVADDQMARIRAGGGPAFIWVKMERLTSHTSTDDQKLYRPKEELATMSDRDPLKVLATQLAAEGIVSAEEFAALDAEVREKVRAEYAAAELAPNPGPDEVESNVRVAAPELDNEIAPAGKYRMGDTVNLTLRAGLRADSHRVIFGEDVEDPKGGVFTLTKRLSTEFPQRVFNSPLAESTILGVACGLASYGWRPVFEIQFIDFIHPAWNQLVTNLSTLRWRSNGKWTCPAVIYAPYGAYLPGGSLWHSQANESAIAHFPGLNVVIPSTPEDAAGLLWTAMHTEDPTLFLIPKHMLWAERTVASPINAVPLGHARLVTEGTDVTIVAWGNTVEKSLEAVAEMGSEVSVELIDLRTIVPWDRELIEASVRKTGRLIVVQEDSENCSVGQMIISHLTGRPDVWSRLVATPILVSKGNVMIGYNPIYEYAALPDTARIIEAVNRVLSGTRRVLASAEPIQEITLQDIAPFQPDPVPALEAPAETFPVGAVGEIIVKVPVMGEGIREARIVSLLKKPGDPVALDDSLCEVETDKAVYPIQSSYLGTFREWKVKMDDTVEIGRDIAVLDVKGAPAAPKPTPAVNPPHRAPPPPQAARRQQVALAARSASVLTADGEGTVEPALPPAILRRLGGVIPTNLQRDARWTPIRTARESAKKQGLDYSPSLMVAWCVTQAMKKHGGFRRMVERDGSILQTLNFDLGIAVALDGGRLTTAVIHGANRLDWAEFAGD